MTSLVTCREFVAPLFLNFVPGFVRFVYPLVLCAKSLYQYIEGCIQIQCSECGGGDGGDCEKGGVVCVLVSRREKL